MLVVWRMRCGKTRFNLKMIQKFKCCAQPSNSMTSFARKQYPNVVIGARFPNAVI